MGDETSESRTVLWSFTVDDEARPSVDLPETRPDDQLLKDLAIELRARQSAADVLEERAAAALGVNRSGARCVELLLREGPTTAGALSRRLGLSRSGTTPVLDRLEEAGIVRRIRLAAADRRQIVVELTADGRAAAQGVWDELYEPLGRLASRHTRSELQLVQDFLRRANAILSGDEPEGPDESGTAVEGDERIFRPVPKPNRPANRLR